MIVTFYTYRDTFYQAAAIDMAAQCRNLGIPCDTRPAQEFNGLPCDTKVARFYVQQQKPQFILDRLQEHRRPVWWCDADTTIRKLPPAIPTHCWMAAHHQPHKPKYEIMSHVLYFRPVTEAFDFLAAWQKQILQGMSDHTPLVMTFKRWKVKPAGAGILLSNFNDWAVYNGFNSPTHRHPVHGDRVTTIAK